MQGETEHRESDNEATADVWLRAVSNFDYPTFFEYAGLSIEGRVHIDASSCVVEGRNRFYEIENRSGNEMLFCTSETDSKSFE
ncbi:MAG: hypothetical protein K2Z81_20180, partial [Cyanobacteria bacterium]|nr:hypothetical protein [Cyanobacteriota bacterium]